MQRPIKDLTHNFAVRLVTAQVMGSGLSLFFTRREQRTSCANGPEHHYADVELRLLCGPVHRLLLSSLHSELHVEYGGHKVFSI